MPYYILVFTYLLPFLHISVSTGQASEENKPLAPWKQKVATDKPIFNKHAVVVPSQVVPCSTGGCKEGALTWNLCTCTHLYKKDRRISLVEEDSWISCKIKIKHGNKETNSSLTYKMEI